MSGIRLPQKSAVLCLLILGFLVPAGLYAQAISPNRLPGITVENPLQQLRQRLSGSGTAGTLALEGALDPDAYVVGPGDQFSVSAGGAAPIDLQAVVSADGRLILPGIATIDAAGKPLRDVQTEAREAMQAQFRNVPVEVALSQPRQFYVHVSGAVPEANRYLVMPVSRVSDVIELAYAARLPYLQAASGAPRTPEGQVQGLSSASTERPDLSEQFRPSLRNVILDRGGKTISLDLLRYFSTGDTDHNPYVLDGDVLTVPAYHVERDAVLVTGETAYPGAYDYRPGDTVLDLLRIASGSRDLRSIERVRLIRASTTGQPEILNVADMLQNESSAVEVRPGDRIDVLTEEVETAAIYGFVTYPGTYPIESGKTTLQELIDLAGGLKPEANLHAAYIERRESHYFKGDGRATDLDLFSRAYLQQEFSRNRLVVNVEQALLNNQAVVLYSGDTVVFPRDESTVFVAGHVPQSGYIPFVPGQTAAYYIQAAGGKGPLASGVYVFDNKGNVRRGEDAPVYTGDTVFINREGIPDNPELAQLAISDQASKRQTRILTTQTIIAGVSALTGILTTAVALGLFSGGN